MGTIVSALFLVTAGLFVYAFLKGRTPYATAIAFGLFGGAAMVFVAGAIAIVKASHVGVVTTFGKIQSETLPEGIHLILPVSVVHEVYTGVEVVTVNGAEASSKDLQSVHTSMTVNFHPVAERARDLYAINTSLSYATLIVPPAAQEIFKAVVSRYTAEELITKRQEVSEAIHAALAAKVQPYFLTVQSVQLVNFGFSKSFDAAIEEKVTATQKAATAQRNLERVKYEAESRIAQAKGEAEAIRIQAESVSKAGGDEYVKLKAVEKWNGQLPQYVTGGAAMPFVNVK